MWLRTFLEDLLRVVGDRRPEPSWEPAPGGPAFLAGERMDERTWQLLRALYELTATDSNTWAGFGWTGCCQARCEFQMDCGHDGVPVWVEVDDQQADGVRAALVRANRHWSTHQEAARSLFTEGRHSA